MLLQLPFSCQVIIEGFKSYKDQIFSDYFSPKINTVGMLPHFVLVSAPNEVIL